MEKNLIIQDIQKGKTALGIEFGSTRIKAVLVGSDNTPIASGAHDWENQYENNIWTYSLDAIWNGLQDCYTKMAEDVKNQYGVTLTTIGALGFSAMMHGYMAFDKNNKLLMEQLKKDGSYNAFCYQGNDNEAWQIFGTLCELHGYIKKYWG